jgi:chemotaxis protein methyltransferase CheR
VIASPPAPPAAAAEPAPAAGPVLRDDEVLALLDHLFIRTGVDFRRYSQPAVRRRLRHVMLQDGLRSVRELRAWLGPPQAAARLAGRLQVKVTTMFRDPPFWRAFRQLVVPLLRPLPFVRVWHAGCATGEEAYSLAIVLREAGLYHRSRIYATDVDDAALERARAGSYPLEDAREFTLGYVQAGGTAAFSEYYTASSAGVAMREHVRRHLVFSRHNLATDASFNEFHVVLCRNVLIYFGAALQERTHALVWRSLVPGGVLGLGRREIVPGLEARPYASLDPTGKLYRRLPLPAPSQAPVPRVDGRPTALT